jgi:FkbM family methyltransferase
MSIRWNRIDALVVHEVMCAGYRVRCSPNRILDLGANIGAAMAYFAQLWPKASIACVEPQAENVSVLRHTIALNGLSAEVFPAAVAVEDGVIEFFVDTGDPSSSSLQGGPDWEKRSVSALSVPALMQKMGWDSIDLLKIDIEGYEAQLFSRNADWLARTSEITGEAHHGYSTHALTEDLGRYGFNVEILSSNEHDGMRVFHAFKKL